MKTPSSTVTPWYTSAAVLDLDPVADTDAAVDVGILADHAVIADDGAFTHLDAVPDARALADPRVGRHVGGRMDHGWLHLRCAC